MGMKKIPLTQGLFALVDDEDFEWLSQWKWWIQEAGQTFYAVRGIRKNGKLTVVLMHRLIIGARDEFLVDHKNGYGLDNRRFNLREATRAQNKINVHHLNRNNTSGVTGVGWYGRTQQWRAQITVNKKVKTIGYFDDKDDAIAARKENEKRYFGEYAPQ